MGWVGLGWGGAHQVRIFRLLHHRNVIELDVEVLVNALEDPFELDVVLKLHCDFLVDESLEKATTPKSPPTGG